eukprot:2609490-Amphidinium_carterae.1
MAYICSDALVQTVNCTGCMGPNSELAEQYNPTANIILRANQPPAGTRAVLNLLTASRQLSVSPYGFLVPVEVISFVAAMQVDADKVVSQGVFLHVGKTYLTDGQAPPDDLVTLTAVDDEVANWVGHYIGVVRVKSSLSIKRGCCREVSICHPPIDNRFVRCSEDFVFFEFNDIDLDL